MHRYLLELLESRRHLSADMGAFPAWSPTFVGAICYEEWPGVSAKGVDSATETGPLSVGGKLATFHGLEDVDPDTLTATIHWGDFTGGHAGTVTVNADGSVDVSADYKYAGEGRYDISVQLSGGYELLRVDPGPRFMDWNLWDPNPYATYRHLYQFATVPVEISAEWTPPIEIEVDVEVPVDPEPTSVAMLQPPVTNESTSLPQIDSVLELDSEQTVPGILG